MDQNTPLPISLTIAPAVFLGNDILFEKLERVILTPDNLFDIGFAAEKNTNPNPQRHLWGNPRAKHGGKDSNQQEKPDPKPDREEEAIYFPLVSFYDFLNITLSYLPYLSPQHLAALPQRLALGYGADIPGAKKTTSKKDSKGHGHSHGHSIAGFLPFQVATVKQMLGGGFIFNKAMDKLLITILASLTLRGLIAMDLTGITDKKAQEEVAAWRTAAMAQIIPMIKRNIFLSWYQTGFVKSFIKSLSVIKLFGKGNAERQIYHLTCLHQEFALANLDLYYRVEQQKGAHKKIFSSALSGKSWLRTKTIHYHLLELYDMAANQDLVVHSPFLTLLNLTSLTHWLLNGTDEQPEEIVQHSIKQWRHELSTSINKKSQDNLFDHYPVYRQVLDRVDDQLRSLSLLGGKKKSEVSPDDAIPSKLPICLTDNNLILSMVGRDRQKKRPSKPSYFLPWQRREENKKEKPWQVDKSDLTSGDLMMTFDLVFKKKTFIESGVWLLPDSSGGGLLDHLLAWRPFHNLVEKKQYHYLGNGLKLATGRAGYWRNGACQKFLLPGGDMIIAKKKFINKDKKSWEVERKIFMPRAKKSKVYVEVIEKIVAPGGIDFFFLLPLSPDIKAFGKSDSHIKELEEHWQRAIKKHTADNNGQGATSGVIEPLIPHENPDAKLLNKIHSLQEIFLQSSDKPSGRLVAQGATLSLTRGFFLNDFMPEPCQVILLSGQTVPGETKISWILELRG